MKFEEYICIKKDNEGNNINYYFDNILIYFSDLGKNEHLYLEILLVIPLYLIFCFFEFTCEIMIIYYLNPIYILIKDILFYFFLRLIIFLIDNSFMPLTLFLFIESAEFLTLLEYSVYLAIIELRFL